VVSLMPGTLAVEAEGNTLTLHLLDASPESRAVALARLRDLEARVARADGRRHRGSTGGPLRGTRGAAPALSPGGARYFF
jgi:hypothetical protein